MTSPICTVQDGAGAPQATTNGANVTNGNTVTVALVSNAGVNTWTLQCIGTDDLNAAAAINAGITINALAKTATFPAPAIGSGLIFQSQVNGGLGANFTIDKTLTTTFGIWTLTGGGYRVGVQNETFEGNATYGWLTKVNAFFRAGSSGVGTVAYTMDAGSSSVAAGQCLCLATGGTKVTSVMTSGALAAAGAVLGMALSSAAANGNCTLSVEGIVPNSITGLGAGTVSAVRVNTSTGYAQRVASFSVSDYPLGYCNASGDLTLVRGIVVGVAPTGSAGGALGGTYPNPTIALASNTGLTGILDATKVATGGALSGASMNAAAIALAGNAGLTGKLDLSKQTAPTTTGVLSVPTATTSGTYDTAAVPVNGANGVAGTDATSKVALANTHGARISAYVFKDASTYASHLTTITSTTYVDTAATITIAEALSVGDQVKIWSRANYNTDTSNSGSFLISVVENGATITLTETETQPGAIAYGQGIATMRTVVTATAAGTYVVKIQGKRLAGSANVYLDARTTLVVEVIRP